MNRKKFLRTFGNSFRSGHLIARQSFTSKQRNIFTELLEPLHSMESESKRGYLGGKDFAFNRIFRR